MGIEIKLSNSLKDNNNAGKYEHIKFQNINYSGQKAMLVVMIYVPKQFDVSDTSDENLDKVLKRNSGAKFWIEFANKEGFAKCGTFWRTLHGTSDPKSRGVPLSMLASKIAGETHRCREILLPYGCRSRQFRSETHRVGQRAIDSFMTQVLLPMGARFIPPTTGCEGGAVDREIIFSDGSRKSAQIKKVSSSLHCAGFRASMHRREGSIRGEDGKVQKLYRPYHVDDNIDLFVFVALDEDENVGTYWAATPKDLLGNSSDEQLISNEECRGKITFQLHPQIEDKERLEDLRKNGDGQDALAVRTRKWVDALGPVVSVKKACKLKKEEDAKRLALRLSAKAEKAAVAAREAKEAAAAASNAGPSTIVNNITNNNYNITNNFNITAPDAPKHCITDYFAKRQKLE
jgi:hypothetical protein